MPTVKCNKKIIEVWSGMTMCVQQKSAESSRLPRQSLWTKCLVLYGHNVSFGKMSFGKMSFGKMQDKV